ncbi:MAG TPA: hypothetical protein VM925_20590 [Labilithrix sp.]|nr:hypothetical protein [Labilithrix sp.]
MFKLHRAFALMTSLLVVGVSAGCSTAGDDSSSSVDQNFEQSVAPLARFAPYLKTLKTTLEAEETVEKIAERLLASGRPATFSLQALCRVYGKADPQFNVIRDDFKRLEDGIGAYAKWDDLYQAAVSGGKDAATVERLKGQRDEALTRFTKLLTEQQWRTEAGAPTRLKTIEDFLNGFAWQTRAEDRKTVLAHLIDELEDLKSTTYDMKVLEHGDGVHELRRDLRWVLIEQLGLNGMIVVKDANDACPIAAYSALTSASRYTSLRATAVEPDPCRVSLCVVGAAAKAVDEIGNVKDQAETEVNLNGDADVVPERLQAQAQAIYDGMVQNDLIGVYLAELNACKAGL